MLFESVKMIRKGSDRRWTDNDFLMVMILANLMKCLTSIYWLLRKKYKELKIKTFDNIFHDVINYINTKTKPLKSHQKIFVSLLRSMQIQTQCFIKLIYF